MPSPTVLIVAAHNVVARALGTGTTELLYPRNPRLPFDEACSIV